MAALVDYSIQIEKKFLTLYISLPSFQVVYLIGALIGMGACVYVWLGQGDFFHSYGVYGVASLYGKTSRDEEGEGHYYTTLI